MEIKKQDNGKIGKELDKNKPRDFTRVHSTIHLFIQQEEVWEITGMMWMRPQDKSNRRGSKRIKCKDICNDTQRKRSTKPMAGWTTKSRFNCEIKVKICSTMFLYSQKRQLITVDSRL